MAGIYIPGIEMPKSCDNCAHPTCILWQSVYGGERHEKCPIVPVPDHGRLIDADALLVKCTSPIADFNSSYTFTTTPERINEYMATKINSVPTIILADKEE